MNREEGPIVASFRFCFFFLGRLRYIICSNLSTAAFTSPNEAIKAVRLKKKTTISQSVSHSVPVWLLGWPSAPPWAVHETMAHRKTGLLAGSDPSSRSSSVGQKGLRGPWFHMCCCPHWLLARRKPITSNRSASPHPLGVQHAKESLSWPLCWSSLLALAVRARPVVGSLETNPS